MNSSCIALFVYQRRTLKLIKESYMHLYLNYVIIHFIYPPFSRLAMFLLVELRFTIFPPLPVLTRPTSDFLLDVIFQHEFDGRVFVSGIFSRLRHCLAYESKDFVYLFQWHRGPSHVKAESLLVNI